MHTLLILEPDHFHAALVLAEPQPGLSRQVHVYACPGPELQSFLLRVASINRKLSGETRWRLVVHESESPADRLINERRGDVVVLANRNDQKLPVIARLHEAGLCVLADKPWILDLDGLAAVERVTAGPPVTMDMMSGRHETLATLLCRVVAERHLFGDFVSTEAAIEIDAVHHLCKLVGGEPVRRPAWYYDVNQQGDGMVDLHSHMVDTVQWLIGDERAQEFAHDVELLAARRYVTPVPLEVFQESTGESRFPDTLGNRLDDGRLMLACNGSIDYRIAGVRVRQQAQWRLRQPAGTGDLYRVKVRGRHCRATLETGPQTGDRTRLQLVTRSQGREVTMRRLLDGWCAEYPGLELEQNGEAGWTITLSEPDPWHENLPDVLAEFLSLVDRGEWPQSIARRIRLRYSLIAQARALALSTAQEL